MFFDILFPKTSFGFFILSLAFFSLTSNSSTISSSAISETTYPESFENPPKEKGVWVTPLITFPDIAISVFKITKKTMAKTTAKRNNKEYFLEVFTPLFKGFVPTYLFLTSPFLSL